MLYFIELLLLLSYSNFLLFSNRFFEEEKSFGDAHTTCVRSSTEDNLNGRLLYVGNLKHIDTSKLPKGPIRINGEIIRGKEEAGYYPRPKTFHLSIIIINCNSNYWCGVFEIYYGFDAVFFCFKQAAFNSERRTPTLREKAIHDHAHTGALRMLSCLMVFQYHRCCQRFRSQFCSFKV
jgi:hypothetical protein